MVDQVSMDEAFLKKVQEAIEKNYADANFGVEELAREVGISRAQLYRKLQSLTGKAANQMIREFRLQRAYELLQMRFLTISEIAYQVGFSSPSYFNTCFRQYFGYPPGKIKPGTPVRTRKKFFRSRIITYISLATAFVAILALLVFKLGPGKDRVMTKDRGKQTYIAVLPFAYLSEDKAYEHLADAMMDEIILHLCYNQDLRVIPRICVEIYRGEEKDLKQIARELNVTYILDGSFQKQGDQVNIYVYLVHARTNRIEWRHKYSEKWTDILTIQSQIAQRITRELDIEITPDVKRIMEKLSTTSPDAADFYWRGTNELNKFNSKDSGALERADRLFHEAIRIDSTYARAYVGLARVYWEKHYWETFLDDDFADSALILANKALSFDRHLAEAYVIRGEYYRKINNREQAILELDKAISLNPSSAEAYIEKGNLYVYVDLVNDIENFHKAASLDKGNDLPQLLRHLGWAYANAGFKDIAYNHMMNALELDDDSAAYYSAVSKIEHGFGDFNKAIELGKKSYVIDSTDNVLIYLIGLNYSFLDNYEEYLVWLRRNEEKQIKNGYTINWATFTGIFRLAHAYGINGFKEEANYYISEGLALYDKMLELNRHFAADIVSFYHLASVYAFLGDKEKAYEYLNQVNEKPGMLLYMIPCIHYDPMFDSLREDPEFQQIVRDVESKYQAEHERVQKWMEQNDMI